MLCYTYEYIDIHVHGYLKEHTPTDSTFCVSASHSTENNKKLAKQTEHACRVQHTTRG